MNYTNSSYGTHTQISYSITPTKATIIQILLEEKHITVGEVITLLITKKQISTLPQSYLPNEFPFIYCNNTNVL